MCIFCAAVSMSAALGAAATGKQRQQRLDAQSITTVTPDTATPAPLPIGKMTAAVTGGLIICSAVYHLVVVPHTGMIA